MRAGRDFDRFNDWRVPSSTIRSGLKVKCESAFSEVAPGVVQRVSVTMIYNKRIVWSQDETMQQTKRVVPDIERISPLSCRPSMRAYPRPIN